MKFSDSRYNGNGKRYRVLCILHSEFITIIMLYYYRTNVLFEDYRLSVLIRPENFFSFILLITSQFENFDFHLLLYFHQINIYRRNRLKWLHFEYIFGLFDCVHFTFNRNLKQAMHIRNLTFLVKSRKLIAMFNVDS